jgi:regulator of protease activity HflC (stomatin/prohibitin superfamily)
MRFFKKQYQVRPNGVGYLFRNNQFERKLTPGFYRVWDMHNRTEMFLLPNPEFQNYLIVNNQEVLTKDNIALRFSFVITYRVTNGLTFLGCFALDTPDFHKIMDGADKRINNIAQLYIRNRISAMESETLNEKRGELAHFKTEEMVKEASKFGITIDDAQLRDMTFPKHIQELFAKHLEAKIRAKSELENARTAVATARALKNASELMKGDENLKFFQIIETITKIAEKGKHTFMIGDINQLAK